MVAANFRRTHSPSQLTWSGGWRPPGAQSAFINSRSDFCHDDSTINIVVVIIIIIRGANIKRNDCVHRKFADINMRLDFFDFGALITDLLINLLTFVEQSFLLCLDNHLAITDTTVLRVCSD